MASLTAIALGVSLITTSVLTLHDTVKKAQHANGFLSFLLTQNINIGAQYAITCVTSAFEQRVNTRGQYLKDTIKDMSTNFVSDRLNELQDRINQTINEFKISSLAPKSQNQSAPFKKQQQKTDKSLWQSFTSFKESVTKQIDKQVKQYYSLRRQKQRKVLQNLYGLYKESQNIYNDSWITPYNIIMLIVFGISSFFLPKLTIILSLSYFFSTEVYLLSDTLTAATSSQIFKNLKFQRVFEFHLAMIGSCIGYNRYNFYKGNRGLKYKGMSQSF